MLKKNIFTIKNLKSEYRNKSISVNYLYKNLVLIKDSIDLL